MMAYFEDEPGADFVAGILKLEEVDIEWAV
jgi:hypothetical protein